MKGMRGVMLNFRTLKESNLLVPWDGVFGKHTIAMDRTLPKFYVNKGVLGSNAFFFNVNDPRSIPDDLPFVSYVATRTFWRSVPSSFTEPNNPKNPIQELLYICPLGKRGVTIWRRSSICINV
jgi:hypothetical protein